MRGTGRQELSNSCEEFEGRGLWPHMPLPAVRAQAAVCMIALSRRPMSRRVLRKVERKLRGGWECSRDSYKRHNRVRREQVPYIIHGDRYSTVKEGEGESTSPEKKPLWHLRYHCADRALSTIVYRYPQATRIALKRSLPSLGRAT